MEETVLKRLMILAAFRIATAANSTEQGFQGEEIRNEHLRRCMSLECCSRAPLRGESWGDGSAMDGPRNC